MVEEDKPKVYSIPENFLDESRIINGMFRTRNFIEGIIMGGVAAIPALLIPAESFNTRIALITVFAAPLFLLGNSGFNGDPISTTVKNARNWLKSRRMMLYNSGTRALKDTPLHVMMERPQPSDKILDLMDNLRESRMERAAKVRYIEGETFEFARDDELEDIYVDENISLRMTEESFVADEAIRVMPSNTMDHGKQPIKNPSRKRPEAGIEKASEDSDKLNEENLDNLEVVIEGSQTIEKDELF